VRMLLNRELSLLSICAAALLFCTAGATQAQNTPNAAGANAQKYGVAVVDIPYVFKNYSKFQATSDSMKKEMETIDASVKAERANLAKAEQLRNSYAAGSAEYKKADEDLARMMAEFQLKTSKLQKDFMERQAKLYYQTYLEVVEAVGRYAKSRGIGLVMRFNGEPVNPDKREDVMRDINKQVVIQDGIDITPDVLMLLNRDGGAAPRTAQPASQLPTR
jgi:Skp family chaperone for outer membrane proteins